MLAGACINTNFVAGIHKHGNVDDSSRLQSRRLSDIVGRIASHTWLGTLHRQLHEVGQLHRYYGFGLTIYQQLHNITLFEKTHSITQHLLRNGLLIEGFGIHEDVVITIDIQELPALMLDAHVFNPFTCAEAYFNNPSSSQILQVRAHKRAPVAWTHMMKLGHRIEFVVIAYNHAVVKIRCCCPPQWRNPLSFKQKITFYHLT